MQPPVGAILGVAPGSGSCYMFGLTWHFVPCLLLGYWGSGTQVSVKEGMVGYLKYVHNNTPIQKFSDIRNTFSLEFLGGGSESMDGPLGVYHFYF